MSQPPLVVDLDGTLIRTDMLHESAIRLLRDAPWRVLQLPGWLAQGKAALKQRLAGVNGFDAEILPYHADLLTWLKAQREAGRKLVLCTASDAAIARDIAAHLGIFDEVMASDGARNLAGRHKAQALIERFGQGGYDYAGNADADLAVWQGARRAIVVAAPNGLQERAAQLCEVERSFEAAPGGPKIWLRALRLHQWLKNLLLFVPLVASHQYANAQGWQALLLAFLSFGLCASSVYVVNDLFDLDSDRRHPRKRERPFASGALPVWQGVVIAPVLLLVSLGLALAVGGLFLPWLAAYFLVTCAYSWRLKRLMVVDAITLALLYTLRIIAGAAALDLPSSFWLLTFSIFLFTSLAFIKRYAELEIQVLEGKQKIAGRGYYTTDAPLIQSVGIASGYASVLVLALYLNTDIVVRLYRSPEVIWGELPVMLFWISWMWIQAHRGNMHDDPLIFALKDRASLLAGAVFAVVFVIGSVGWPW